MSSFIFSNVRGTFEEPVASKNLVLVTVKVKADLFFHFLLIFGLRNFYPFIKKRRHDIQHNDTQHNGIQHNDAKHIAIQHNDAKHDDIQHNDTKYNDTQHNDIKHNGTHDRMTFSVTQNMPLSIMEDHCYAECHLC